MIQSKKDYKYYLNRDKEANKIYSVSSSMRITWNYIKKLRKYEYYLNTKRPLNRIFVNCARLSLHSVSVKSGIQIPPNVFGAGLYLPHFGAIVVNETARFGDDCVVQCGVNISEGVCGGNHIYIGAGAKIMKNVSIEDDVIIGANAVVTKDIEEKNVAVAGIPSRKVSDIGFLNRNKPI